MKTILRIAILIFTFLPALRGRELEICPPWTIIVLNEKAQPVSGLKVLQIWRYYGLAEKEQDQRDIAVTDMQGRVSFPARALSIDAAEFAAAQTANGANLNVHDNAFGPVATIVVTEKEGYMRPKSVICEKGNVLSSDDPLRKTENDNNGFTTIYTLQRSDIYDAIGKREFARAKQFILGDPSASNRQSASGFTPLDELLRSGQNNPEAVELAKLLISAGADINRHNKVTPLCIAARLSNIEMMRILLSKGAKFDPISYDPVRLDTPLHSVVVPGVGITDANKDVQIKAIDLLLAYGIDINAKNSDGNTPLHLAADYGDPKVVQALLERGADPAIRNAKGETPMDFTKHYTASAGLAAIQELLTHPPPAKLKNSK